MCLILYYLGFVLSYLFVSYVFNMLTKNLFIFYQLVFGEDKLEWRGLDLHLE